MATYLEVRQLFNDSDLLNKVTVAVVIAANNLLSGTPTAAEKAWAAEVFSRPGIAGKQAVMAVLAENNALSVAAIQGASDSAIQSGVNTVVSTLVDALAGV